jgi:hypothetical protein
MSPWSSFCSCQSQPVPASCNNPYLPSAFRSIKGILRQNLVLDVEGRYKIYISKLPQHVSLVQACLTTNVSYYWIYFSLSTHPYSWIQTNSPFH